MVRYTGPKNRIARRFGVNIFGRARNPLLHKASPPGQHGAKRKKKSDYGTQLDEKQKLKAIYGMISQKQLVRYYKEALQKKGVTSHLFLRRLECRLDNVVYRLKFAPTIFAAQQLVSHGHVYVNGKKVDRRSFEVKAGMAISVKAKSQAMGLIKDSIANTSRDIPEYLELDAAAFSGKLLSEPHLDQIPFPMPVNIAMVCEHIAHTN
jgi:small subunit ribosomal protein S4